MEGVEQLVMPNGELDMKTMKRIPSAVAIIALAFTISACGKTQRFENEELSTSAAVLAPPAPTPPPASSTPGSGGTAPYSFEFVKNGNQTYTSNAVTTDNVLKVKFKVGSTQGNSVHNATELNVVIRVNGTDVLPTYTSSNYTYGQVGETSNLIDFSSYLSPGVPVQIQVLTPQSDYYCTYAPNPFYYWDENTYAWQPVNPLYNSYPGCRKAVFSSHQWSGTILVQTNSTTEI